MEGKTLQARNPFGAIRVSMSGGLPAPVKGFPAFSSGAVVLSGRSEDLAASPDGKWILYVEPLSPRLRQARADRCDDGKQDSNRRRR